MKKHVYFLLILFFVSQNNINASCQNPENSNIESTQLTKKEERKLKRQQEKEEKKLREEQEEIEKLKQEKLLQEQQNNETLPVQTEENNEQTNLNNIEKNEDIINHSSKKEDEKLIDKENTLPNQNQQNLEKDSNSTTHNSSNGGYLFWFLIIIIIPLLIIRYRYKRKCDGCKKWNAMKKIRTECVDQKPSVIVNILKDRNSKNEVIRTREEHIPATVYYYRTHRKCKYCGFKDYLSSSEKKAN